MSDLISVTAADFRSALGEFEAAWENPNHTRFNLAGSSSEQRVGRKIRYEFADKINAPHGLGHGAAKGVGSGDLHSLCCI